MAVLRLAALLAFEVAAVAILTWAGAQPGLRVPLDGMSQWLAQSSPSDAVVGLMRLAALALAWWLLATTALYAATSLTGARRALRAVGRLTLPAVRALADRAVAVTLAVTVSVPPAAGASLTAAVQGAAADAAPAVPAGPVPPYPLAAAGQPAGQASPPPPPAAGESGRTGPQTHLVAPGDNLWAVARDRVGEATGRPPSGRQVYAYWLRLLDVNRPRLSSGDPDLIFPGEVLLLPAQPPGVPPGPEAPHHGTVGR